MRSRVVSCSLRRMGRPKKNLVGQVFGKLTVLRRDNADIGYWVCRCACGTAEHRVAVSNLGRGVTSCGCGAYRPSIKDLTGQRFGRLVVTGLAGKSPARWFVVCDCGGKKSILGGHLSGGKIKSCGCVGRLPRTGTLPPEVPSAVWLPLGEGRFTLVDASDAPSLSKHFWSLGAGGYAVRNYRRRPTALHLFLLSTALQVDHANGDKLDNRRANLREATLTQQRHNQRVRRDNLSGFKGVSFHRPSGRWRARLKVAGREVIASLHATPEEAAHAHDTAARKFCGDFACVNFPRPGERGAR